jgi:hypothetical protein
MNGDDRVFEHCWQFYDGQHVVFEPQRMTALELQTSIVQGYRRFYSLRRSLGYLARLRFGNVGEHLWGRLFIHRWLKDTRNRDYIRGLAQRTGLAQAARGATAVPEPGAPAGERAGGG